MADLRGMKVRGPTRQVTKLLGALGAIPVGMPLPQIPDALSKGTIEAVSYTHLRAHETVLDLVCRLLLEKKTKKQKKKQKQTQYSTQK